MKPKLLIVYILLITLPLAILGWLGFYAITLERESMDQGLGTVINGMLDIQDRQIQDILYRHVKEWESAPWDVNDPDALREYLRKDGHITQIFCLNDRGDLLFPHKDKNSTERERDFLIRTKGIWQSGGFNLNEFSQQEETNLSNYVHTSSKSFNKDNSYNYIKQGLWHEWYWGNGLQLLYWWPTESGIIYGVEVNRERLISDIIGEIGYTDVDTDRINDPYGFQLFGTSDHLLFQWGYPDLEADAKPFARRRLSAPLGAWTMKGYLGVHKNTTKKNIIFMVLILLTFLGFLLLLSLYFYRESTRELREAAQRVNFVNHVSHELKTPLTNIRMYAELLQEDLETDQESHRLGVILSESQRLSRLIANVLTFNREQQSSLSLHPQPVNIDTLIRQVLEHFESSFSHQGIRIELDLGVNEDVTIDSDIAEQIIGNLLSNVEKYARNGDAVTIRSSLLPDRIEIQVQDHGPGIPASEAKAIFDPFYRVCNDLTEGVAGTGIGLSISRDLARLHGGDLVLVPGNTGACFILSLALQGDAS